MFMLICIATYLYSCLKLSKVYNIVCNNVIMYITVKSTVAVKPRDFSIQVVPFYPKGCQLYSKQLCLKFLHTIQILYTFELTHVVSDEEITI